MSLVLPDDAARHSGDPEFFANVPFRYLLPRNFPARIDFAPTWMRSANLLPPVSAGARVDVRRFRIPHPVFLLRPSRMDSRVQSTMVRRRWQSDCEPRDSTSIGAIAAVVFAS